MTEADAPQAKSADAPTPLAPLTGRPDSFVDWLLLRPITRKLRIFRTEVRASHYLQRKATTIDLAGAEPYLREAIFATIAFNRPDLIEWQIHLVRRHCA